MGVFQQTARFKKGSRIVHGVSDEMIDIARQLEKDGKKLDAQYAAIPRPMKKSTE